MAFVHQCNAYDICGFHGQVCCLMYLCSHARSTSYRVSNCVALDVSMTQNTSTLTTSPTVSPYGTRPTMVSPYGNCTAGLRIDLTCSIWPMGPVELLRLRL